MSYTNIKSIEIFHHQTLLAPNFPGLAYFFKVYSAESNLRDEAGNLCWHTWYKCTGDDIQTMKQIYLMGFDTEMGELKWIGNKSGTGVIKHMKELLNHTRPIMEMCLTAVEFPSRNTLEEKLCRGIAGLLPKETRLAEGDFLTFKTNDPEVAWEMYYMQKWGYNYENIDWILRRGTEMSWKILPALEKILKNK